jgi:hypothetical protein
VASSSSGDLESEPVVLLRHGTTRQRAERILQNGPDLRYVEPGGSFDDPAKGFSTARIKEEYNLGSPEEYARRKANNFPQEGGPVLLEIEVPESIVRKANRAESEEVRFEPGWGLTELLDAWPKLTKRVIPL